TPGRVPSSPTASRRCPHASAVPRRCDNASRARPECRDCGDALRTVGTGGGEIATAEAAKRIDWQRRLRAKAGELRPAQRSGSWMAAGRRHRRQHNEINATPGSGGELQAVVTRGCENARAPGRRLPSGPAGQQYRAEVQAKVEVPGEPEVTVERVDRWVQQYLHRMPPRRCRQRLDQRDTTRAPGGLQADLQASD